MVVEIGVEKEVVEGKEEVLVVEEKVVEGKEKVFVVEEEVEGL